MENLLDRKRREFRVVGLVLFEVAAGLLVSRILAQLLSGVIGDTMLDVVFSLLMQVGFLLVGPFLIYKFCLKRSALGVLELSNVRKPNPFIMLLCLPLGVCCIITTMGVSMIWLLILMAFGYTPGSSAPLPEQFSLGLLFLNLFLTAVLPAICEEFTNRGGLVTAFRGSFTEGRAIVLCGLAFGLFHQNITQFFYTFLFGMLMATLVIKTKSIFPGVLVHFLNNGISVYLDFAEAYTLPLGGFFDGIKNMIMNNFGLAVLLWLMVTAAGVGIVFAILCIARDDRRKKYGWGEKKPVTDVFSEDEEDIAVSDSGDEKPSEPLADKVLYKPVLRDWAFYIGALVMTALTTVLTFLWGVI